MTVHKLPIKKYNIIKRQTARLPLAVKAPTIVGGGNKKRKQPQKSKKKKSQRGGGDPWGRDVATTQMGDKLWEIVSPLLEGADGVTPQLLAQTKDLLYRGSWDAITDEIRPQMGTSAAQFFSHIPLIGAPLAGISNIVGNL
jgi:hypothetical protein